MFETSMLIFELLWDIVFAILILRLAFFYYAVTLLTGFILGIGVLEYLFGATTMVQP